MKTLNILVVEDEPEIQELIGYNLDKSGHQVVFASTGEEALEMYKLHSPQMLLLDLMLPGMSGLKVCKELKTSENPPLIIMLTARGEEADIVRGLEVGADDYITKPFSPKVLIARIEAVARRKGNPEEDSRILSFENLKMDLNAHKVFVKGKAVSLTPTEFAVLKTLMNRSGWVFTRGQIVDEVKGDYGAVTDRSIDVVMVGLRKKLGQAGQLLQTIRGVGYRLGD